MVQVRAFDTGSGAPGNCAEFLGAGLATAMRQALKAFPESFGYHAGHGFARLLGYGRCEPMGFGIFDVERLHICIFCKASKILPFYHQWLGAGLGTRPGACPTRSEEHTSELQS